MLAANSGLTSQTAKFDENCFNTLCLHFLDLGSKASFGCSLLCQWLQIGDTRAKNLDASREQLGRDPSCCFVLGVVNLPSRRGLPGCHCNAECGFQLLDLDRLGKAASLHVFMFAWTVGI